MDGGSAISVSFSARVTGSREVMRTRLRPARARSSSAGTSSAVDIFCAPSILANARVLPLFRRLHSRTTLASSADPRMRCAQPNPACGTPSPQG